MLSALREYAYSKFYNQKKGIFSYFCSNIDCGYSLEPSRLDGFNEYSQSMFFEQNNKNNV